MDADLFEVVLFFDESFPLLLLLPLLELDPLHLLRYHWLLGISLRFRFQGMKVGSLPYCRAVTLLLKKYCPHGHYTYKSHECIVEYHKLLSVCYEVGPSHTALPARCC